MTENNLSKIIAAGGKVYKYRKGFNHAKTLVIDNQYAVVGTTNIDYRSMFLHFECCNLLMKTKQKKTIKKDFEDTLLVSNEVDLNLNKKERVQDLRNKCFDVMTTRSNTSENFEYIKYIKNSTDN